MDAIAELYRKLHNLIRFAQIAQVDGHLCKVTAGGLTSDWLPWITQRAGNDRTWWAPSVGEQVVWFSPGGLPSTGVILAGLYQTDHPAPTTSQDKHQTTYRDGAVIFYDAKNHLLKADIPGDADVHTTGNLTAKIDGNTDITVGKNLSANITGDATTTVGKNLTATVTKSAEITAGTDITASTTSGNVSVTAASNIALTAVGNIALTATGNITLTGAAINLNG